MDGVFHCNVLLDQAKEEKKIKKLVDTVKSATVKEH